MQPLKLSLLKSSREQAAATSESSWPTQDRHLPASGSTLTASLSTPCTAPSPGEQFAAPLIGRDGWQAPGTGKADMRRLPIWRGPYYPRYVPLQAVRRQLQAAASWAAGCPSTRMGARNCFHFPHL